MNGFGAPILRNTKFQLLPISQNDLGGLGGNESFQIASSAWPKTALHFAFQDGTPQKDHIVMCTFSGYFSIFDRSRPKIGNHPPTTYCIRAMQGPKNSCRHPLHIIIISIKYTYILYIYTNIDISYKL